MMNAKNIQTILAIIYFNLLSQRDFFVFIVIVLEMWSSNSSQLMTHRYLISIRWYFWPAPHFPAPIRGRSI